MERMKERTKTFRNLDEQINILRHKGLIINVADEERVKDILFRENYYFISGYRHLFMRNNADKLFLPGTNFDELYAMFNFDRNIRNVFIQYLLVVENNMKSIFSYELSKKYGYREKDYLKPSNFTDDSIRKRQVEDLIYKMKRQIRINGFKHSATNHYLSNFGYIPLWVLVKVLSFGLISELYTILKNDDQLSISSYYNLDVMTLKTYFHVLANYRNLCAHEDIVYDHRTERQIPDSHYHYKLDIPMTNGEYIYGKNDLFSLIIIFKKLLTDEEFANMIVRLTNEVDKLDSKLKVISINKVLDACGIPLNFADLVEEEVDENKMD